MTILLPFPRRWPITPSRPSARASSCAAASTRTCTSRRTSRRAGSPTSSWRERCRELGLAGLRAEVALHRHGRARGGGQRGRPGVRRARARSCSTTRSAASTPTAVEVAARQGARIVWLPTVSSRERVRPRSSDADPDGKVPVWVRFELELREAGARPAAGAGRSTPTARRCPAARGARRRRRATAWCWRPATCRRDEIFARRRRRGRGGRRDDRRDPPRVPVAAAQPGRPAGAGRAAARCWSARSPRRTRASARGSEIFAATRAVGAAPHRLGLATSARSSTRRSRTAWRIMADRFLEAGFSDEEVRTMAVENTRASPGWRDAVGGSR